MRVQVSQLASLWLRGDEESAQSIGQRADEKIDSYANGELDHAMEAMTLLWEHSRRLHSNPLRAQDIPGVIDRPRQASHEAVNQRTYLTGSCRTLGNVA